MKDFKRWLLPVAIVSLLLAVLIGGSCAPQPLGEVLDPSGNPFAHRFSDVKDIRTATFVVAASDSEHRYEADYFCDGTDDHIQIQAALDALPTTGGEVKLLDGTYNIETEYGIVLDNNQTLRGCGRNTILKTSIYDDATVITATGGSGTEKVGILVADLRIIGSFTSDNYYGIWFRYVDHSRIENVVSEDNSEDSGIYLDYCDWNVITGCTCHSNWGQGIRLANSSDNLIIGNKCWGNGMYGMWFSSSHRNVIAGNHCSGNASYGISVSNSNNNIIAENVFYLNGGFGITLSGADNSIIKGNLCSTNSQSMDNTYDNIRLANSDYNLIEGNLCRAPTIGSTLDVGEPITETEISVTNVAGFEVGMGVVIDLGGPNKEYHRIITISGGVPGVITIDAGLTFAQGAATTIDVPEAQYGIYIFDDTSIKNVIIGNDLYDSGKTANFKDAGTCTIVWEDNRDIDPIQVKHLIYVQNTSGGNLLTGNVVKYNAAAGSVGFTTPTAVGDDGVWGMLVEDINNNAYGYIQVLGGTTLLDATNAGGAIVIGSFLCAEIGNRARLATTGEMVFAIALETCNAEDCVIDALIIVPRKI